MKIHHQQPQQKKQVNSDDEDSSEEQKDKVLPQVPSQTNHYNPQTCFSKTKKESIDLYDMYYEETVVQKSKSKSNFKKKFGKKDFQLIDYDPHASVKNSHAELSL